MDIKQQPLGAASAIFNKQNFYWMVTQYCTGDSFVFYHKVLILTSLCAFTSISIVIISFGQMRQSHDLPAWIVGMLQLDTPFQEKDAKLLPSSSCPFPPLTVLVLKDSCCSEMIKNPVWLCLVFSACSQAQESQQGGAEQGRRLGVGSLWSGCNESTVPGNRWVIAGVGTVLPSAPSCGMISGLSGNARRCLWV